MTYCFCSPIAVDLQGFLCFKRSLGYRYARAEFTLLEFDRFLQKYTDQHQRWRLDEAALAFLSSKPARKAISVSGDAAVLRQLYSYLRRLPQHASTSEPIWPKLPTESAFTPYVFSKMDVLRLLDESARLGRPTFRAPLYRALLLLLYCTGIRFGEALLLRFRDVDTRARTLFVETFKGRARWVPFHHSLALELDQYLIVRYAFAPSEPDDRLFVGINRETLPVSTAQRTLRKLFQQVGLKPQRGRVGPRPYDFRHTFAVQRLSQWYRQGVDLYARLPWLSAYMGHDDILGTETYLTATPELLRLASSRLHQRYLNAREEKS
jgi:integrase/recombinase XerD